jgi:hypothetical protein
MEEEAQAVLALAAGNDTFLGVTRSPCHGDLWPGNVLVGADGRWWVLDGNGLAVGDEAEDLATLAWPFVDSEGRDWRDLLGAEGDRSFATRMDLHLRALASDSLIDVLADWSECDVPEWRGAVRRREEEEHRRYLDWYLGRWGRSARPPRSWPRCVGLRGGAPAPRPTRRPGLRLAHTPHLPKGEGSAAGRLAHSQRRGPIAKLPRAARGATPGKASALMGSEQKRRGRRGAGPHRFRPGAMDFIDFGIEGVRSMESMGALWVRRRLDAVGRSERRRTPGRGAARRPRPPRTGFVPHHLRAEPIPLSGELAEVVAAWSSLSEHIILAIIALAARTSWPSGLAEPLEASPRSASAVFCWP